jgi:hypothetical protein
MNTITTGALVRRINRNLAPDGLRLRKTRGTRDFCNLGDFYLHHGHRNCVSVHHVDPEALGHELGVLGAGEKVGGER